MSFVALLILTGYRIIASRTDEVSQLTRLQAFATGAISPYQ